MSLKSTVEAALPVAGGVILAGLAMYYLGGTVSLLQSAAKGFTGANSTTAATTANTGFLASITGGLL